MKLNKGITMDDKYLLTHERKSQGWISKVIAMFAVLLAIIFLPVTVAGMTMTETANVSVSLVAFAIVLFCEYWVARMSGYKVF